MKPATVESSACATIEAPEVTINATESDTQLPSMDEFLALVEDESKETVENPSMYSVYHKYSKSC